MAKKQTHAAYRIIDPNPPKAVQEMLKQMAAEKILSAYQRETCKTFVEKNI